MNDFYDYGSEYGSTNTILNHIQAIENIKILKQKLASAQKVRDYTKLLYPIGVRRNGTRIGSAGETGCDWFVFNKAQYNGNEEWRNSSPIDALRVALSDPDFGTQEDVSWGADCTGKVIRQGHSIKYGKYKILVKVYWGVDV